MGKRSFCKVCPQAFFCFLLQHFSPILTLPIFQAAPQLAECLEEATHNSAGKLSTISIVLPDNGDFLSFLKVITVSSNPSTYSFTLLYFTLSESHKSPSFYCSHSHRLKLTLKFIETDRSLSKYLRSDYK